MFQVEETFISFTDVLSTIELFAKIVSVLSFFVGFVLIIYYTVFKGSLRRQTEKNLKKYRNQTKYNSDLYVECDRAHEIIRYAVGTKKWRKRLKKQIKDTRNSVNCLSKKWEKIVGCDARIPIGCSINKLKKSLDIMRAYYKGVKNCHGKYVNIDGIDVYKESLNVQRAIRVLDDYEEILNAIKASALVVSSTAGNGKSFLLARIAEMLRDSRRSVLFLNARDMNDDPENEFWKCFFEGAFKQSVSMLLLRIMSFVAIITGRRIIIIIDAINENDSEKFKNGITNLILFLQKLKGIKVIVSCRKEYIGNRFKDVFDSLGIIKVMDKYRSNIKYRGNDDTVFLELSKMLDPSLQRLFLSKYKEHFCFRGLILEYVEHRLLQCSRLTIRAFFECYQNKNETVGSFKRAAIMESFVNNLCKTSNTTWDQLCLLAKKMLELNQYYNIPQHELGSLYDRLQTVDNTLISQSPLESIDSSSLVKPHEDLFSFSFDELRDFFIARVLVIENKDEKEILKVIQSLKSNNGLYSGGYELSPFEGVVSFLYLFYHDEKNEEMCKEILSVLIRNTRVDLPTLFHEHDDMYLGLQLIFDCGGPQEQFEIKYVEWLFNIGDPGIIDDMISYYDQTHDWSAFIALLVKIDEESVKKILTRFFAFDRPHYYRSDSVQDTFHRCIDKNSMYCFLLLCHSLDCVSCYGIECVIDGWMPKIEDLSSFFPYSFPTNYWDKILQGDKTIRMHLYEK